MNQDEIIEIARQAGIDYIEHISKDSMKKVKAFVKLVAAKEREACARIVESNADACRSDGFAQMYLYSNATAIRARGEA